MRFIALLSLMALVAAGCNKDEAEPATEEDPTVALDHALADLAEVSEAYAASHEGLLPETGVMVFCRNADAASQAGTVFEELGYRQTDGLSDNAALCFNVSRDRQRVALSAAIDMTVPSMRCMVVDVSGPAPVRDAIVTTEACQP